MKPNGLLLALQSPNSGHGLLRTYPTNIFWSKSENVLHENGDPVVHGEGKRWLLQSHPVLLEKVSFKGCMNNSIFNHCLFCYVWWIELSNFIHFLDLIDFLMQKNILFCNCCFITGAFLMTFSIKVHPDLFWFHFWQWLSCWELLGMLPFSNKLSLRFVLCQFSSVYSFKG